MGFRLIKDISLFMLVFSVINDNFMVDNIAGKYVLKVIFGFFLLVNFKDIFDSFLKPKNNVMKFFYLFVVVFSTVILINVILQVITFTQGLLVLIPILTIFVYISYYEYFDKLLYFIWASVIVSSIISVMSEPITQWTFRKTGGTGDPNEFATQLLAAMAVTVYLFYKNRNHLFLWPSIGLFMYAFLYAGSKSAFLTMGVLLLFAIFVKFRFLIRKLFSLKVLLGILVIGIVIANLNISDMTAVKGMEARAQSAGTAETRFVSWNAGIRMAEHNFFTGVGAEQYEKHAREYATDYIAEGSFAPHNILIKMIGENGIFPFIAFLAFLFVLFTSRFKKLIESDYFWIYLAALSTILMGLTLSITYEKYFWMFLALLSHASLVLWAKESEGEINEDHAHSA